MVASFKDLIPNRIKEKLIKIYQTIELIRLQHLDCKRYRKYSSAINKDYTYEQITGTITRYYHSIEKGLAFDIIKPGFGKKQISSLLNLLKVYKNHNYPLDSVCFKTAIDTLLQYIKIQEKINYDVTKLKEIVFALSEDTNADTGGIHNMIKKSILQKLRGDFLEFSQSRYSVRNYSNQPVEIQSIEEAINFAQNTPSSCNRQTWKTRIVRDNILKNILINNQFGNRGFGERIDSLIIITVDNQYYDATIERNQGFVDGGMYALNLIYSLHYYGLATCPLSASLTLKQEENLRKYFEISESEIIILFIAVGNYADSFKVPKSTRREASIISYS